MTVAFTNQASTTLAGGITALSTSLTLAATTGANFPATSGNAWFYLTLVDQLTNWTKYEIVKVTTRSSDTCSVVVRAQDGTTAQAWPSGTYAQLRLTKGTFDDLTVQYANNADNLSNLASASTARTNLGLGSISTQAASAVAITGGTANALTLTASAFNGTIGATTPSTGAFTTVSATGQITSTLAIGTAPLVVTSTTVVGNLNVSQLLGATWTAPGAIGSVTPSTGAFTTLAASGTVSGAGFAAYLASPPAIGGGTPADGTFAALNATTIRAVTSINMRGLDNASATNTGYGEGVLAANAGGVSNTGVGNNSLADNTTGIRNTAIGAEALAVNTTGTNNASVGFNSMSSSTTGVHNTAIGSSALEFTGRTVTAGSFVVGVTYTIQSSGSTNFVAVGAADNAVGTIFTATGVGAGTGTAASATSYNVGVGSLSLSSNETGARNVGVGYGALRLNVGASNNVGMGGLAVYNNVSGDGNVGIGDTALTNVGAVVTAGSFVATVSYEIVTVGTTDFTLIGAANNNIGTSFTATGAGVGTGTASPNANKNTAVGFEAGTVIVGGINNTIIGADADVTSASQTNSTAIGYGATATVDNQVVLGNASVVQYKLPGTAAHVSYAGSYSSAIPVTETAATHTVAIATSDLICDRAGTITVTLPAAATYPGRELYIKTIQAQTVVSNASNVVPLVGGAAGTAICAGVDGSWARLKSDATNWIIMAGV